MIYADEAFYHEQYLLERKPVISTGFRFYARNASQIIDKYTFDRLNSLSEVPEEVSMCCCELAEAEFQQEKRQSATGGKTSEKIGTYAVTFGSAQESAQSFAKAQHSIIYKWLGDTGLLYQGVE